MNQVFLCAHVMHRYGVYKVKADIRHETLGFIFEDISHLLSALHCYIKCHEYAVCTHSMLYVPIL